MVKKAADFSSRHVSYYDLLEVSPRARPEVIEAAYKALIKQYHPDKSDGDERRAKALNEARDVLLDPKERARYDQEQVRGKSPRDHFSGGHSEDYSNLVGKMVGSFQALELIAEGGFGKTYRGEHSKDHFPVCIKRGDNISPQDQEILLQEADAIWELRHYGIPAMRDVVHLDDGSVALVMSYVPGPTLEQIVEKHGGLDPEHVAWIAERTLNVLWYLHLHGVVHGDVKPQNIIIQPKDHQVVLVDYGLSLIRPSTTTNNKGYTPYFAPPEQEKGTGTLLPESDFYSLGMVMIYALGGDVESRRVPSAVPDPLCNFIQRCIVYNVLSRPNWQKENLLETMQQLRVQVFGRKHSNMKPLPGVDGG
ncbi:MAG TPA: protein kinase [Candidatus Nanoarchaeia archaeon]|nr:protein kinase [Candidatus Nanoarchaeia archaeon]